MRGGVSSPDNEVRLGLVALHGLQGRLHQQEGRVAGVVTEGSHPLVCLVGVRLVTEVTAVSPRHVLVVKVKVGDVPEFSSVGQRHPEETLQYRTVSIESLIMIIIMINSMVFTKMRAKDLILELLQVTSER